MTPQRHPHRPDDQRIRDDEPGNDNEPAIGDEQPTWDAAEPTGDDEPARGDHNTLTWDDEPAWDDDEPVTLWPTEHDDEPLHSGGTHLLDFVAAVDHLNRGLRRDLTIWDALDEAIRWWLTDQHTTTHGAPDEPDPPDEPAGDDPLRITVARLADHLDADPGVYVPDALQQAVRRWNDTMAQRYNAGHHWPQPRPRRGFPPPRRQAPRG